MVSKGRLIIGTGIILACAGGVLLSDRERPVEYEEGACYYLAFTRKQKTGAEWKQIGCDALEDLLEEHPETAYVDADGTVHSGTEPSIDEESEEDYSCLNPYDEGLSVDEKIDRVACWYDLRPEFLHGLWEVESRKDHWDSGQVDGVKRSYAGAVGIAQVMPGHTGKSAVDGHELDINEEVDNMELGAQTLEGKCSSAVSIANANGFETRPTSDEEPCGAIRYVCVGKWGNASSASGSVPGSLVEVWYTAPEDVMARAYNGVSCGGNLFYFFNQLFLAREYSESDAWSKAVRRAPVTSYWTIHYVEHVQNEGGTAEHSFDDAP